MVPQYSSDAARTLGFLKSAFNDVEIFVEDASLQNVYNILFRKWLPTNIKFSTVNPLGCREDVISACARDQADDGRRKLYIIDGDLDFVFGVSPPELKYLYRLNGYCFENVLLSDVSVCGVAIVCKPDAHESEIRSQIDFENWMSDTSARLLPLFVLYALIHFSGMAKKPVTVQYSVHRFVCSTPGDIVDRKRVLSRVRQLLQDIHLHLGAREARKLRKRVQEYIARSKLSSASFISGKSYLLPLLQKRMKALLSYNRNVEQFSAELATHCGECADPELEVRIRALAL